MQRALQGIEFRDCCHLTFATDRPLDVQGRIRLVAHPRRQVTRTLLNALQSFNILLQERPRLVISTGADVAVPVFILARLMGAQTIFIETGGSLEPTLAGRLCYRFANLFIVQWPERLHVFPKAQLAEGLLL